MSSLQGTNIVAELEDFLERLKSYQWYQAAFLRRKLTAPKVDLMEQLRDELVREIGRLKPIISELTGKEYVTKFAKGQKQELDMWFLGLSQFPNSETHAKVLSYCVDATNQAIGKLKSDIEVGYRDGQGNVIRKPPAMDTEAPKAFIAHGGKSAALNRLCDFLEALGVEPLVVEIQPSEGRLTEPQVDEHMEQADCAIILATYGHIEDVKTGKKHPRLNVVDELGRCRKVFPHRTILPLEKGVDLPSNVSGIVYEHFTKQNMDKALIKVAKELRAFGLIKAIKR